MRHIDKALKHRSAGVALALALAVGYPSVAAAVPAYYETEGFGTAAALGDFNGDGRDELVVGVSDTDLPDQYNDNDDAGSIRVYNSLPGSTAYHEISLATPGIPGNPHEYDRFGYALAVGDFDRDGYDDLAVGSPGRDSDDRGGVYVIYGRSTGLQNFNRVITHGPPAADGPAADPRFGFGWSLAVGDFGGDSADDLAIGMPGRSVLTRRRAGAVFIRYGATGVGTSSMNAQIWHQDVAGVPGVADYAYLFGWALAAGQLGYTSKDDLAIGIPGHEVSGQLEAGAVMVMFGASTVLGAANAQLIHQNWGSTHGTAEYEDAFGAALAVGRFGSDAFDDLAVGVPDEDVSGYIDAGFVNIMYGSSTGVSSTQQSSLALDGSEGEELGNYDFFGNKLTVGDFDDNGYDDLAAGAPSDVYGGGVGSVTVYYSASSGLSSTNYQYWTTGVGGYLGADALVAGDFDGNGIEDLVVSSDLNSGVVVGIEGRRYTGLTTLEGFALTRY